MLAFRSLTTITASMRQGSRALISHNLLNNLVFCSRDTVQHVFGEGLGKEAQRIVKKKIWIMIVGGKVYLHRT